MRGEVERWRSQGMHLFVQPGILWRHMKVRCETSPLTLGLYAQDAAVLAIAGEIGQEWRPQFLRPPGCSRV